MTDEKKVEEVKVEEVNTQEVTPEPELKDPTVTDEKTLKTEGGKEIKLNFIDGGDRKEEDDKALEAGVEVAPAKSLEQRVDEKMAEIDMHIGNFANMLGQANLEVSGLITALLMRGLITHQELQKGIEAVQNRINEEAKKAAGGQGPEIIRQKPTGHGDNGVVGG